MRLATNASAGAATSSTGGAELEQPPVQENADAIGERGRVLEVVRDEERRQSQLPEQLGELEPDRRSRVCASSADSGSSSSRTAGSRASARARPTRWRSPPESSRGRARARCVDPEALEQLARRARVRRTRRCARRVRCGKSA